MGDLFFQPLTSEVTQCRGKDEHCAKREQCAEDDRYNPVYVAVLTCPPNAKHRDRDEESAKGGRVQTNSR